MLLSTPSPSPAAPRARHLLCFNNRLSCYGNFSLQVVSLHPSPSVLRCWLALNILFEIYLGKGRIARHAAPHPWQHTLYISFYPEQREIKYSM